jgi:hypothetical protein
LKLTNVGILVCSSLSETIKTCLMSTVISVGKVETSNTHSALDELLKLVYLPTSRSKSTYNLGMTIG